MRKDREQALKLRLSGKSYTQIQNQLRIPKSTLSGWLGNVVIAPELKAKIESRAFIKSREALIKRNIGQTLIAQRRAKSIKEEAKREIQNISARDLHLLGIALYWAEGYKRPIMRNGREMTHHPVSLTNSDPFLVRCFLKFLVEYCDIPLSRVKVGLRIFPHQNESIVKKFWHDQTNIPLENFNKTLRIVSKSSLGKRPFNRLENGVVQISVADTKLYHRIMGYIEKIKELV